MTVKTVRLPDGREVYTSLEGDIVDHLCWRHYGRENETTEAVLLANPGLAARGIVLPAGVPIVLPFIAARAETRRDTVNLFD